MSALGRVLIERGPAKVQEQIEGLRGLDPYFLPPAPRLSQPQFAPGRVDARDA